VHPLPEENMPQGMTIALLSKRLMFDGGVVYYKFRLLLVERMKEF